MANEALRSTRQSTLKSGFHEGFLREGHPEKDQGWYTAFYRYAEYLRFLTQGALNHKSLYAYIGLNGKCVNSENPLMRKRCASGLSRLLHSSNYSDDFQESLQRNPAVFRDAARCLARDLQRETKFDQEILVRFLVDEGCEQLRTGLVAEIPEGRSDVQTARLDGEMTLLRAWAYGQLALGAESCLQDVLCQFFYFMAFGHLEEDFANALVDASPTDVLTRDDDEKQPASLRACVMRAVDGNPASIENMWALGHEGVFRIGRYVDCDAVETNGLVSRRHCSIFRVGDCWYVRDEGSRYGTAVRRGGQTVWHSDGACGSEVRDGSGDGVRGGGSAQVGTTAQSGSAPGGGGASGVGSAPGGASAQVGAVQRDGSPAPAEVPDGTCGHDCFPLEFGDCLVLAGQAHYWFVSLQNIERLLVG